MGVSYRMFLVDESDRIYRLAVPKFDEMLRNPPKHSYPLFAGQRVRAAGAVVQLARRKPTEMPRLTFHILTFDQAGCLDGEAFQQQQSSRFEVAMTPLLRELKIEPGAGTAVVNASSRFSARGGLWAPSKPLARAINDVALGRVKCPRL